MSGWENFLVAQVGASAALAGLLAVLVLSSLLLMPQPLTAAGIELLLAGLVDTAILLFLVAYSRRKMDPRYYGYLWLRGTLSLCATLPFAIAGIAVLVWNTGGLYWLVPATLLSITVAIYDAWVLLVEINR